MDPVASVEGADGLDPGEAFAILGNGTRLAVLQALDGADRPLGFSELQRTVGASDSGGFNYHLDRLEGQFIERTDEGYRLRMAGKQVVNAVIAGAITRDPSFGPVRIDGACPHCGSPIEAGYDDETLSVRCTDESCRRHALPESVDPLSRGTLLRIDVPPAALAGRTPEGVVRAAMTWFGARIMAAVGGVCPNCAGTVEPAVTVCPDHDASGEFCERCDSLFGAWATHSCVVCGFGVTVPGWIHALAHPDAVAFFGDHGLDVAPLTWETFADGSVRPAEEAIESVDPPSCRFVFRVDGDELRVTLGDGLRVVGVEA